MSVNIHNDVGDVISCVALFYEKEKSGNLFRRKEKFLAVTRTLYTRQNRSNALKKRFGDIKRTPLWVDLYLNSVKNLLLH